MSGLDDWSVRVWIEQDEETKAPLYEAEVCDVSPGGGQTALWRGRGPSTDLALVNLARTLCVELEARGHYLPDDYRDACLDEERR